MQTCFNCKSNSHFISTCFIGLIEQLKLAQLQKLEEEIEAAKKKKQLETETAQYQDK